VSGILSKNIKSENVNSKIFSEDDIQYAVDVVNMFSDTLENCRLIVSGMIHKHSSGVISLDSDTEQVLLEWAKSFIALKEHIKNLNNNTKYN